MKAVVLGSAAGGGFPQWNCRCANCELAWQKDPRARWRTQSSLALSAGEDVVLVNASPDIGQQLRSHDLLQPRSSRHSPVSTVVLTSAEIDHVAGLATLRERHAFDLVALSPVQAAIVGNPLFEPLQARRVTAAADEQFERSSGLWFSLFPVPGKVPLYLEAEGVIESADGEVAGLVARQGGASLLYVPGCADISEPLNEKALQADVILFDGTLFDDEEMIRAGLGTKTGRRMGHMPMTGPGGSLDWLAALPASRKIYVHINNSNPVLIEGSRERRLVESAGVEIAHDGLEIVL